MPPSIRIKPTMADALAGVCNSPTKCMYAICLWRMFPSASHISVNPNCITITMNGRYYHYMLPMKGVLCMSNYDKTGPAITSEEIVAAEITVTATYDRKAGYMSTPEVRAKHRIKSAKYRARPEYDPRSKATLRAIVSRSVEYRAAVKAAAAIPAP